MSGVSFQLPDSIKERIYAVPISRYPERIDKKVWTGSSYGCPTVASVHKFLKEKSLVHENVDQRGWNWIWNCKTIPRIKSFIWLCNHGRISTAQHLSRRGINMSPLCSQCNHEEEDVIHVLRDCRVAKDVWFGLEFQHTTHNFFSESISDWIYSNCRNNSQHPSGLKWSCIFTTAMWLIWKNRNSLIFKNTAFSPNLPQLVVSQARDISALLEKPYSLRTTSIIDVRWTPPPHGWTKLNTDGSAIGSPGPAGAGGVLRNEWGGWISGFQRRVGITNSLIAELWALKDGLTLAKDLDIDLIYVESDAKEAINLILEEPNDDRPLMPLILDCRLLLESFRGCKFRHTFREANKVADILAKKAGMMDNQFIVHSRPPSFVYLPMMFDCQGQTEARVIVDNIG